jgi:branched-chain amino acid transport system ATP-binding protein
MLDIKDIVVKYDKVEALKGVSLRIAKGTIVSILGSNGAGKSTAVNAISGIVPLSSGEIWFEGKRIDGLEPHEIVKLGITQVPEGKRVFPYMTVYENIKMGAAMRKWNRGIDDDFGRIYEIFPILRERRNQRGVSLSGGEQQMLVIARGLMAKPKLFLLDEPSLGLAPIIVEQLAKIIAHINQQGTNILLVEQNAAIAIELAQWSYVLEVGKVVLEGSREQLQNNPYVKKAYLSI